MFSVVWRVPMELNAILEKNSREPITKEEYERAVRLMSSGIKTSERECGLCVVRRVATPSHVLIGLPICSACAGVCLSQKVYFDGTLIRGRGRLHGIGTE